MKQEKPQQITQIDLAKLRKDLQTIMDEIDSTPAGVWAALGAGKVVNGCKGKEAWAAWANPTAKHPLRNFQLIMKEKPEGEVTSPRPKPLELLKELIKMISEGREGDGLVKRAGEIADLIKYEPPDWKMHRLTIHISDGAKRSASTLCGFSGYSLPAGWAKLGEPPTCEECLALQKKEPKHPQVVAMEKTLAATAAVNGAKLVHETIPGGPKVLEVAIPGEFSTDPPRLKYYVCVGDQKHPHPALNVAKAACDQMLEQQGAAHVHLSKGSGTRLESTR
jgi:hypothetical protein